MNPFSTAIHGLETDAALRHYPASTFPTIHPIHWLTSHFAVGGYSPLRRLSGMLTAHMTEIAPHNGFTWHPHRGLEIFTYVIDGELYHEDTTGGKGVIGAGEVQRMFSGHYIEHQELNRTAAPVRVIQIWFVAETRYMGLAPHYEQVPLAKMSARRAGDGVVREIIGPAGNTDAHVDARLTATTVPAGGSAPIQPPRADEDLFLYVVDGTGRWQNGTTAPLDLYDVMLGTPDMPQASIHAGEEPLIFLSFYLRPFLDRR